jgi:hypothetical protein
LYIPIKIIITTKSTKGLMDVVVSTYLYFEGMMFTVINIIKMTLPTGYFVKYCLETDSLTGNQTNRTRRLAEA